MFLMPLAPHASTRPVMLLAVPIALLLVYQLLMVPMHLGFETLAPWWIAFGVWWKVETNKKRFYDTLVFFWSWSWCWKKPHICRICPLIESSCTAAWLTNDPRLMDIEVPSRSGFKYLYYLDLLKVDFFTFSEGKSPFCTTIWDDTVFFCFFSQPPEANLRLLCPLCNTLQISYFHLRSSSHERL